MIAGKRHSLEGFARSGIASERWLAITPMWFFFSLIPATLPLVVGYFVLFSSTKTAGAVGAFGKILAVWLFILAAFFPIAGAYISLAGISPFDTLMQKMESMHSGGNSQK